jgi:hypothetical protein
MMIEIVRMTGVITLRWDAPVRDLEGNDVIKSGDGDDLNDGFSRIRSQVTVKSYNKKDK